MKKILIVSIVLLLCGTIFTVNTTAVIEISNIVDYESNSLNINNDLTEYWGFLDIKLNEGSGYFNITKDGNGVWWFVTPNGYAFYSVGRESVDPFMRRMYQVNVLARYGNFYAWAENTTERFKDWHLNTLGAWSKYNYFEGVPYAHIFIFKSEGHFKWNQNVRAHPDVFDKDWWKFVDNNISEVTEKLKNDTWLIGYYLDNEINWGPDSHDQETLLEEYLSVPYEDHRPGKDAVVEFLIDRYKDNGGLDEFNKVWNMELTCWDELYDKTSLCREGWRILSKSKIVKIKLFREDKSLLFNPRLLERAESDIEDFNHLVARSYYENITNMIKNHDPNHLILGDRFHGQGVPEEVLEECGNYCDVISINYYRHCLYFYRPIVEGKYRIWHFYDLVPLNNWMEQYNEKTGRPLIIGEWGRHDFEWPFGEIITKFPEKNIANYDLIFARKCLESPYMVGHQGWYINGLVDLYDDPYPLIVKNTRVINSKIYDIHRISNN